MTEYAEFIAGKHPRVARCGLDAVDESRFPAALYPHQRAICRWALRRGRAAIFADTGLGKTAMMLAWASYLATETVRPALILAPLAVTSQTAREGERFGVPVTICREGSDVRPGVNVANYERVHKLDTDQFAAVVLDESSILKNFSGKIRKDLTARFASTPYRLCCTATPAPNDHMELGNHAEFLSIMHGTEMLMRWFQNDTTQAGAYFLKPHAVADFWAWVSSWGICLRHPRDAGFDTEGYDLPPLTVHDHVVDPPETEAADGELFHLPDMSATGMHKELRITANVRAAKVAELVAREPDEQWLIWCHSNYEADALALAVPGLVDVRGDDSDETKESRLLGFIDGSVRYLSTKPEIGGMGLNLQNCARVAFVGGSYSYERYYQSVRRCYRFGQAREVHVHRVMASTEHALGAAVARKEAAHREMQANMFAAVDTIGALREDLRLNESIEVRTIAGEGWEIRQGDCVERAKEIATGSVDFSIFSPPFSQLYTYSDSARDMGNCTDDEEFWRHYGFLATELYRITRPGRLVACHVKNLVYYKNREGSAGLRDFRGDTIRAMCAAGFDYHSEVTIWKDPVTEMQRTKAQGLLHKQLCTDSTVSRQGLPDYLVMFRRWASEEEESAVVPVAGPSGRERFDRYVGDEPPRDPCADDPRAYSIQVWQRYASPVWFDIRQTDVLNCRQGRDDKDGKHICPLQLPVIQRAVHLWTNPGELVFSPFAGIGSEGVGALREGRRFLGIELKPGYVDVAVRNLRAAVEANALPLLEGIA